MSNYFEVNPAIDDDKFKIQKITTVSDYSLSIPKSHIGFTPSKNPNNGVDSGLPSAVGLPVAPLPRQRKHINGPLFYTIPTPTDANGDLYFPHKFYIGEDGKKYIVSLPTNTVV